MNVYRCRGGFIIHKLFLPGHRSGSHDTSSVVDVIHGDITIVLDVLDLLPVPGRLLQGLDDQGSSRGDNGNLVREYKKHAFIAPCIKIQC